MANPSNSTGPSGPMNVSPGAAIPPGSDPSRTQLATNNGQTELGPRWARSNFNEDRNTFQDQTVYFDYDQSAVKASEQGKVQEVAAYLKNEPRSAIEIEGHCDERGTDEYNRALGERRALAIREFLIGLGIPGERINTISYGEDRPAVMGEGESAWAKNRRGEFILLRPKQ